MKRHFIIFGATFLPCTHSLTSKYFKSFSIKSQHHKITYIRRKMVSYRTKIITYQTKEKYIRHIWPNWFDIRHIRQVSTADPYLHDGDCPIGDTSPVQAAHTDPPCYHGTQSGSGGGSRRGKFVHLATSLSRQSSSLRKGPEGGNWIT